MSLMKSLNGYTVYDQEAHDLLALTSIRHQLYDASSISLSCTIDKYNNKGLRLAVMPQNLFNPWFEGGTSRINGASQSGCLTTANGVTVTYNAGKYTLNGTPTSSATWPRKSDGSAAGANMTDALTFGTLLPPGDYVVPALNDEAKNAGIAFFCSILESDAGTYIEMPMSSGRSSEYRFTLTQDAVVFLRISLSSSTVGKTLTNVEVKLGICRADNVMSTWTHGIASATVNNTNGSKATSSISVRGCTWLSSDDITALGLPSTSNISELSATSGSTTYPIYADWLIPAKEYVDQLREEDQVMSLLQTDVIVGTIATPTFHGDVLQKITHAKISDSSVVRTDTFTSTDAEKTEVRTLSTGQKLTLTTNLTTMATTVIYNEGVS